MRNRRYVSNKERIGYLLNDVSSTFNIDNYKERFIYDIVKLDFDFLAVFELLQVCGTQSTIRLSACSLTERELAGANSSPIFFSAKFRLPFWVCGIGLCRLFSQIRPQHMPRNCFFMRFFNYQRNGGHLHLDCECRLYVYHNARPA